MSQLGQSHQASHFRLYLNSGPLAAPRCTNTAKERSELAPSHELHPAPKTTPTMLGYTAALDKESAARQDQAFTSDLGPEN